MVFATGIVFSFPVNWRCWETQQQNIPVKISLFYNRFEVTASPIIHPHSSLPVRFFLNKMDTTMPKKLLKPTLETTNSNMQLETLSLALLLWHLGLFGVQLSQLNTLEYTNSNWGSLKAWSAPIYPKRFPKFTWEYSSSHHMQSYSLTQCAATACSSDTTQKGKEVAFF